MCRVSGLGVDVGMRLLAVAEAAGCRLRWSSSFCWQRYLTPHMVCNTSHSTAPFGSAVCVQPEA